MIRDIGDLRLNQRQKIRLKHINEPRDGQIQDLEAFGIVLLLALNLSYLPPHIWLEEFIFC